MKKVTSTIPDDKLALYDKLIQTIPAIERKGVAMPYTAVNGNMFSFLSPLGTLSLRLPEEAREAFLRKYKTTLMEQHGTVLKEYVAVPDALLKKTKELQKYIELSYDYTRLLKPKPAKKK